MLKGIIKKNYFGFGLFGKYLFYASLAVLVNGNNDILEFFNVLRWLVADITGEAGEVRRALESLRSAGVIVEENEA